MEVRQVRESEIKLIKTDMPEVNIRYTGRSDSMLAADGDAKWQIRREYKSGDIVVSTYANMGSFNCTWTDRATYFSAAVPDPANPLDGTVTIGEVTVIGGATAAKQDTGNTTLANIYTRQADNSQTTQLTNATGNKVGVKLLSVDLEGTDYGLVTNTIIHGLSTAGGGIYVDVKVTPSGALTVECTQSGTWTVARSWTLSSATDSVAAVQGGTWNINNVSGTISLPTGAATSALQTTGNASIASIDTKTPALGQAAMVASSPVVIASDQTAIPALQSGTWTVQPGNTANTTPWLIAGSGTAGTAATGVVTVQGIASMTPLKVDASATTQPISGVVSTKTALTASAPTFATVGVASASAIAADATRTGLAITNTSVNVISLGIGAAAVLYSGITLYPGGSWVMDEYNFTTAEIFAIASAAASNISVQEFTT